MGDIPLHEAEKLEIGRPDGKSGALSSRTGPWKRDTIPRGGPGGTGHRRFRPRLDRVGKLHARWYPARLLEPEVMDTGDEAAAYVDSAAEDHLARLDAGWSAQVLAAGPRGPARVLDVGTGSGQIPSLLAHRRPEWRIWAIDRSSAMLDQGRPQRERQATIARRRARSFRLAVGQAEARRLPFADGAFDLVVSNSLLHHLADPTPVLDEIARVTRPGGGILLRDLRRPSRIAFRPHVAWHGRRYRGAMRRLYEASVAAAFTPAEITILLRHSALAGAEVRVEGPYLVVADPGTQ